MEIVQRESNPDVNTFIPNGNAGGEDPNAPDRDDGSTNVEQPRDDLVIPVPPDVRPTAPIEEPPGTEGPPVGDVDDSPKKIAK
jgi:hypothetical protein